MSKISLSDFEDVKDRNPENNSNDKNIVPVNEFMKIEDNSGNDFNVDEAVDEKETTETVNEEPKNNYTTNLETVLDAEIVVGLIDTIIPSLFVLVLRYIGYSVSKENMQLNTKEKKALEPAINKVLSTINLDFTNPYVNLMVVVGIVYGSKIIDTIPNIKKIDKQSEKKNQRILFETDYNSLVDRVMNERGLTRVKAKKFIDENMKETLSELQKKYGIDDYRDEETDIEEKDIL